MTITVLGRSHWGAGPLRKGALIDHARFVGLAVHHTVMVMRDYDSDGFLRGDLDDVKRYMKALQVARPDLGSEVPYSWVVFAGATDADCVVAEGRGFGVTGAHTTGYNSTRYGVAYAGNASVDRITPGIIAGFRWVGEHLHDPVDAAKTFGHRDTKPTECPGNNLYGKLFLIQPPFHAPTEEEDDMFTDGDHELLADINHRTGDHTKKLIALDASVDALTQAVAAISTKLDEVLDAPPS